jgi:hypothetical protein
MGKNSYGLLTRVVGSVINSGKKAYKESKSESSKREAMGSLVLGRKLEYQNTPSKKERNARKELNAIDFI